MSWNLFLIFFIVSAAGCCIGFKKTVYFLSAGYGISVAALGTAYYVAARAGGYPLGVITCLQCLLFVIYGVRLAGYLFYREIKFSTYREILKNVKGGGGTKEPFPVRFLIWVGVSVLYIMQTCPVFFRAYNGMGNDVVLPVIGLVISLSGLLLESEADLEKSRLKKVNPGKAAMEGVYKIVRSPNYLGEMIFWTGTFIGGVNALRGAGQWLLAAGGFVLILMVMVNSTQRLEKRQEFRYGTDPEYRRYADHTPIVFPFIPLYHLGKHGK